MINIKLKSNYLFGTDCMKRLFQINNSKNIMFISRNNKLNHNLSLLTDKLCSINNIKINLPLSYLNKLISLIPFIFLYPKYRFNLTQAFIYIQSILRRSEVLVGYSIIPEKVQNITKKFKAIKIIQIQSGFLGEEIIDNKYIKSNKLRSTSLFLGMSNYQCDIAKKYFTNKAYNVGLLSTEDWILNNNISCELEGYKYDLCLIFNTRLCRNIKYAVSLIINYLQTNQNAKVCFAMKSKTNINEVTNYCKNIQDINVLKNIYIKKFNKKEYSTLKLALDSKIIVGVRSTSLYQLGSLGMIIYPIDLDQKIFNMSGNLTEINLNPYPTNTEFDKNINHLIIKENRSQYLSKNFNGLIGLDNTLQLKELPSDNIKNILLELQ